jgi:TRAP-type C4-dicarboxylate transport system permease small subunit
MNRPDVGDSAWQRGYAVYADALRLVARGLAGVAGAAILVMIIVTCVDVVMRYCGSPLPGAYDIVNLAGTLTIACGLPYTTAVKGHVAIEFVYHKLGPRGRVVLDTLIRLLILVLFVVLAWQSLQYGFTLREKGQVSPTLKMPEFWVAYVVSLSCAVMVLITLHHLFHPGKALIKL